MKKYNSKQLRASQGRVQSYIAKKQKTFFLILALILAIPAFSFAAAGDDFAFDFGTGGTVVAMSVGLMGTIGSIDDPDAIDKAGTQVKAKLWLLSADQYDDTQSFPPKVDRQRGTIPLLSGETWHYIAAVEDSPEPGSTGESGDMGPTLKNSLTFIVGGLGNQIMNLLEQGTGKGFYIVWEICSTGKRYIGGNGCKPMKLISFEGGAKKDGTGWTLTFENQCGELWCEYIGNTPTVQPALVAADATDFAYSTGVNVYQLQSGAAASATITDITGITDADIGKIITLKGSGGDYPPEIDGIAGNFLLSGGTTWIGNNEAGGRQIDFKVYKTGVDTYVFIEMSRI